MAALPREFPDLALHLTDHTRTPIVSSVSGYGGDEHLEHSDSSSEFQVAIPSASASSKPTRQQRAAALDDLAATALRARDAAARLGLGADIPRVLADAGDGPESSSAALLAALGMTPPEHVVVTYSTGAMLIESFLNPEQLRRRQLHFSQQTQTRPSSSRPGMAGNSSDYTSENNGEYETAGSAPLLLGLVAAPDAHSLGDARRASVRLERVGRAVQQELLLQAQRR